MTTSQPLPRIPAGVRRLTVGLTLLAALAGVALLVATPTPARAATNHSQVERVKIITAGDSITQGVGAATRDSYPHQLARLVGKSAKVVNVGHGGSCLVTVGCGYGLRLIDTFADDVLAKRPDVVIVGIGTNDLCHAATIGPIKAGFRQLRDQAQASGAEILFSTIAPQSSRWLWPCEDQRREVNRWLRSSGLSVVDVDRALSTLAHKLPARFDSGDGCHPSARGYAKIAAAAMRAVRSGLGGWSRDHLIR